MKKHFIALSLLLLSQSNVLAKQGDRPLTLYGRIIDNNGEGVENADVHVNGIPQNKISGIGGSFKFLISGSGGNGSALGRDVEMSVQNDDMIIYEPVSRKIKVPYVHTIKNSVDLHICPLDIAEKYVEKAELDRILNQYVYEKLSINEIIVTNRLKHTDPVNSNNILLHAALALGSSDQQYRLSRAADVNACYQKRDKNDAVESDYALSVLQIAEHKYEDALATLGRMKNQAPDDSRIHFVVGTVLIHTGHPDEAKPELENALRLCDSGSAGNKALIAAIYNNLGVACQRAGDYTNAIIYHKKSLLINEGLYGESHPLTINNYYHLAAVYDLQGNQKLTRQYGNILLNNIYEYYDNGGGDGAAVTNALVKLLDPEGINPVNITRNTTKPVPVNKKTEGDDSLVLTTSSRSFSISINGKKDMFTIYYDKNKKTKTSYTPPYFTQDNETSISNFPYQYR